LGRKNRVKEGVGELIIRAHIVQAEENKGRFPKGGTVSEGEPVSKSGRTDVVARMVKIEQEPGKRSQEFDRMLCIPMVRASQCPESSKSQADPIGRPRLREGSVV